MQPPTPGFPPQWSSSPHDPEQRITPGGQPTPGSYGQPGSGFGYPQAGYGPPGWGGYSSPASGPSAQQLITWIALGVIGLLGLLGAILTLTLWLNMSSAASHAADLCNQFGGEYTSLCRQSIKTAVPSVPATMAIYLVLVILGSLGAASGALLLFLKKYVGQFLILSGGVVMLTFAIVYEAQYSAASRITYDLIAGLLIAVAGGVLFVPAFRTVVGFQPRGQSPYGQPRPPQYGPPSSHEYPPPQW
jgi:hypothetical protein